MIESEPIELVKRALVAKESCFDAQLLLPINFFLAAQLDVGETSLASLRISSKQAALTARLSAIGPH